VVFGLGEALAAASAGAYRRRNYVDDWDAEVAGRLTPAAVPVADSRPSPPAWPRRSVLA
jgi:hypothetical protein